MSSHRPTYFAYVSSVEYVTSLASPSLSALLLSQNMWLPFWVGLVCLGAAAPLTILLPRGDHGKSKRSRRPSRSTNEQEHESTPLLAASPSIEVKGKMSSASKAVRDSITGYKEVLSESRSFQTMLVVFFLKGAAISSNLLLLQYISKRYHWTFAQVSRSDC